MVPWADGLFWSTEWRFSGLGASAAGFGRSCGRAARVLVNRTAFFRVRGLCWGILAARRPGVRPPLGGLGALVGGWLFVIAGGIPIIVGVCWRTGIVRVMLSHGPECGRTNPSVLYATSQRGFETRIGHPAESMAPVTSRGRVRLVGGRNGEERVQSPEIGPRQQIERQRRCGTMMGGSTTRTQGRVSRSWHPEYALRRLATKQHTYRFYMRLCNVDNSV